MESIVAHAIWALVLLSMFSLLALSFGGPLKNLLETWRARLAQDNEMLAVELMERRNEAELTQRTMQAQAELRDAELRQQAAQTRLAATIDEATVEARIKEEKLIIEARAAGRAERAKSDALATPDQTGSSLEALMRGYEAYRKTGGTRAFDSWFGDYCLEGGTIRPT